MTESHSSYPTTNMPKHCKDCGRELEYSWYYRSYPGSLDMDVLDGPYCYTCVRFSPTTTKEEVNI